MKTVFIISLGILIYIYVGYYAVLFLWSKVIKNNLIGNQLRKDTYVPTVSFIISAYNEEGIIRDKILNTLKLDYPKDKLEIILSNDGSKDRTMDIAKEFKEITIFDYKNNEGKTMAQNKSVEGCRGEIIIFSDANSLYKEDSIRKIIANFRDSKVGCVCGELKYKKTEENGASEGEGLYWKFEKKLKRMESNIYSTLGANGAIYAIRRKLYSPLPKDIISDFVEPLMIVKKGYRCIYESEAICYENAEGEYKKEFKRKVRIITRSIRGFFYCKKLLKPNFVGFALISHKLLRWISPIFLVLVVVSNIFYTQGIYKYILFLQMIFYLFAILGIKFKNRILYIPSYFVMINYAALLGIIKFFKGERFISWDTNSR